MRFARFIHLIVVAASCARATPTKRQNAYPDPVPVTEARPGANTNCHDPALVKRADGKWFRFCTLNGIRIDTAPEITGPWDNVGAILPQGSKIKIYPNQGPSNYWAVDVNFIGDQYFAYYSVSTSGSKESDMGVATSPNMEPGTWTDHGSIGIPKSDPYNLIDPNFFRKSTDSPPLFTFGSAWRAIFQTRLDNTFLRVASDAPVPVNLVYNSTDTITEGAYEFWWGVDGKDWYYMFFSNGACCDEPPNLKPPGLEYHVMVCRSESATGPFVDRNGRDCLSQDGGTMVLETHGNVYAPGGQGVMYDPSLKAPIINYHYVDRSRSEPYRYENFLWGFNYLDFSSGWPVIVPLK